MSFVSQNFKCYCTWNLYLFLINTLQHQKMKKNNIFLQYFQKYIQQDQHIQLLKKMAKYIHDVFYVLIYIIQKYVKYNVPNKIFYYIIFIKIKEYFNFLFKNFNLKRISNILFLKNLIKIIFKVYPKSSQIVANKIYQVHSNLYNFFYLFIIYFKCYFQIIYKYRFLFNNLINFMLFIYIYIYIYIRI